ncbi:MAG: dephospho-CoA kinase [Bacteroidales bacterium]|nr:dephospho-CoA kinase [Bacteroidales bacterium]
MKTILLTGGIGSGKSVVAAYLRSKGYPVYDSDSRAKGLYDSSASLLEAVREEFGDEVIGPDDRLDRKALASKVFGDADALSRLNALVHPAVLQDFLDWREQQKGADVVVMESAIALGIKMFRELADAVAYVDAPLELRITRACERDGASREAIAARIQAQHFDMSLVDAVIANDSGLQELYAETDRALAHLLRKMSIFVNSKQTSLNMKTNLARILSVTGKHGLFLYIAQARNGVIAEALETKARTALDMKSRITTLADIAIYTSEGEMKLQEVFLALQAVLGEADAPTSKASSDELKALFEKAIPNYDADRFYVSHMKKVVDWYNELKNFASLDFEEEGAEEAEQTEEENA